MQVKTQQFNFLFKQISWINKRSSSNFVTLMTPVSSLHAHVCRISGFFLIETNQHSYFLGRMIPRLVMQGSLSLCADNKFGTFRHNKVFTAKATQHKACTLSVQQMYITYYVWSWSHQYHCRFSEESWPWRLLCCLPAFHGDNYISQYPGLPSMWYKAFMSGYIFTCKCDGMGHARHLRGSYGIHDQKAKGDS